METRARLINAFRSFENGKTVLTVEVDSCGELDKLTERDLRLTLVPWREKRSLNANAYFHKLCQMMADVLGTSLTEVKNQMIIDYGQLRFRADGEVEHSIKPDGYEFLRDEVNHYMPTQKTQLLDNGVVYRVYIEKRGSHTYDTKEMSRLIDGTVQEAKDLGIETLTPDELERMKASWRAS